jgi:hypothetical protein
MEDAIQLTRIFGNENKLELDLPKFVFAFFPFDAGRREGREAWSLCWRLGPLRDFRFVTSLLRWFFLLRMYEQIVANQKKNSKNQRKNRQKEGTADGQQILVEISVYWTFVVSRVPENTNENLFLDALFCVEGNLFRIRFSWKFHVKSSVELGSDALMEAHRGWQRIRGEEEASIWNTRFDIVCLQSRGNFVASRPNLKAFALEKAWK